MDALLERTTLAGLGAGGGGISSRRLDARVGYGFGMFAERYTATPEIGLGLSDTDRELRLGWRLAEQVSAGLAFELGLEGMRRMFEGADAGAEHGVTAGAGWRLVGRDAESLELRIEGTLREAANDDDPVQDRHRLAARRDLVRRRGRETGDRPAARCVAAHAEGERISLRRRTTDGLDASRPGLLAWENPFSVRRIMAGLSRCKERERPGRSYRRESKQLGPNGSDVPPPGI